MNNALNPQTPIPPLLDFQNTTVYRRDNMALNSISLQIELGENVAIIGPNGCGKSTLIKTITRECYPLAREETMVRIFGETCWDVTKLRSLLGIVSSDLQQVCDRGITGEELILSAFFGSIGLLPIHVVTEAMQERVREVFEFLEIPHLAGKKMNEMSTGQARRVLIGRALVHRPKALMLDEPGNGLDPYAAYRFSNLLRKIARSGKSIILVTHHLQEIIPEITRVIMLRDGQLFRDGLKEEVLTPENLSELFKIPVDVHQKDGFFYLLS